MVDQALYNRTYVRWYYFSHVVVTMMHKLFIHVMHNFCTRLQTWHTISVTEGSLQCKHISEAEVLLCVELP